MGCKLLLVAFLVISLLTDNHRSFVNPAPHDLKNAGDENNLKLYNKNRKFEYFVESKEKHWNGPFYFIQGADIQFGFIGRELENQKEVTWEKEINLAGSIVERINRMRPRPKFFVMCGDLCDAMPDTELEMRQKQEFDFKRLFGKLDKEIPLVCVCGNHDVGNTPTKDTVQMYQSSFGDDFFSFWCGGILFLVINSQYFFDSSKVPEIAEEHAKWIDEKLKEGLSEKKRVVIFQHIPWFLKSFDEEESYFTINQDLRKVWLDKFKKSGVEAIFCGHYHRNAGGVYDGIDVAVTSAVGGQLGNDKSVSDKLNDDSVKELESLKSLVGGGAIGGGDVAFSKSQTSVFSDVNGRKTAFQETKNEVDKNGKLVAKVAQKVDLVKEKNEKPKSVSATEVEIPSKGIHNVIVNNEENLESFIPPSKKKGNRNGEFLRLQNGIDKINSMSGIEYSPLDMAEYIFWTGDEKGVAFTIEEFLEQGMMTRQEAINFLQSIKFNLDFLQAHYQGLQNKGMNPKHESLDQSKSKADLFDGQQDSAKLMSYEVPRSKLDSFEVLPPAAKLKENSYEDVINQKNSENSEQDFSVKRNSNRIEMKSLKKFLNGISVNDDDYEEILERLRVADFLYKEYSLEEVIFQLAKVMFSQSLTKGSIEAQEALQRFTSFLQNEVQQGQISKNLERKILGVLTTALMDTLTEHPELMVAAKEELQNLTDLNIPTSTVLKQLLNSGAERLPGKSKINVGLSSKSVSEKERPFGSH